MAMKERAYTVLTDAAYQAAANSAKRQELSKATPESVTFVKRSGVRWLEFTFASPLGLTAAKISLPVKSIDELRRAKLIDLEQVRLSPSKTSVIVDGVDAFISVEGLLRDLGTQSPPLRAMFAHMFAANGGQRTSGAKKKASAENGKKGGRPKTQPEHALASTAQMLRPLAC